MSQDELYKSAKLDPNADVRSKGKEAMVEDDNDDDGEAGPELPPDMDTEDIPDDEEGRFFGGGMEQKTAQAMQYIDQQEEDEAAVCARTQFLALVMLIIALQPEKFDTAWVRRFALNFEKKISKNAELRAKFENDPQKYVMIWGVLQDVC